MADLSSEQAATDVNGSKDHPMISRIEGSTISAFDLKEFDEYRLATGRVPGSREDYGNWANIEDALNDKNSIRLEGRVWKLMYDVPTGRSTLEIVRSFEAALTKAGFKTLYQCSGPSCSGPEGRRTDGLIDLLMSRVGYSTAGGENTQRYLAARLARAEGDIYVSLLGLELDRPIARLDVIEVKPMKSGLVTVNAATMAEEIATTGRVALYGIYFDTNKTEVKPESRPTLSEIASLLKQNSKLNLIVVGHTDNNGTLDYNLDLSLRRAQAVVTALSTEFGIPQTRLDARGVGFLSPLAPNDTEEQRAKNRRVELLRR